MSAKKVANYVKPSENGNAIYSLLTHHVCVHTNALSVCILTSSWQGKDLSSYVSFKNLWKHFISLTGIVWLATDPL